MATHLGNGAGQAIEVSHSDLHTLTANHLRRIQDAYILSNVMAESIRRGGSVDISKVGKIYDAIRQPFGNSSVRATRNMGLLYEFSAPGFEDVKPGEVLSEERIAELRESIEKNWQWTHQSASGDLERALSMF